MFRSISRSCGTCNQCCQGHLRGEAYGLEFYPGKKCGWLYNGKCSIYPIRPAHPCKDFECGWKHNSMVPDWMAPNKSRAIILYRVLLNHNYWMIVPAGGRPLDKILPWAQEFSTQHRKNIVCAFGGPAVIFAHDQDFLAVAEKEFAVNS